MATMAAADGTLYDGAQTTVVAPDDVVRAGAQTTGVGGFVTWAWPPSRFPVVKSLSTSFVIWQSDIISYRQYRL